MMCAPRSTIIPAASTLHSPHCAMSFLRYGLLYSRTTRTAHATISKKKKFILVRNLTAFCRKFLTIIMYGALRKIRLTRRNTGNVHCLFLTVIMTAVRITITARIVKYRHHPSWMISKLPLILESRFEMGNDTSSFIVNV